MKIGILTYFNAINYGGALQAYALCTYLNTLDEVSAELINYRSKGVEKQYERLKIKDAKSIKAFLLQNATVFARKNKKKNFIHFVEENDLLSASINSIDENLYLDYDVVIVGSDQVWNAFCTDGDKAYLLPLKHPHKIAYAASMGNTKNIEAFFNIYGVDYIKLLSDFRAISSREVDASAYLSEKLADYKRKCSVVVDPVFLLEKEGWKQFRKNIEEDYIFVYNIGNFDLLVKFSKKISKQTRLKIKVINKDIKGDILFCNNEIVSNVGPEDFISLIANAKIVITDSFHATAFSIIFEKEFYTVGNSNINNTNSRLHSLLNKYRLSERFIREIDSKDYSERIDYKKIQEDVITDINKSKEWIIASIKEEEIEGIK